MRKVFLFSMSLLQVVASIVVCSLFCWVRDVSPKLNSSWYFCKKLITATSHKRNEILSDEVLKRAQITAYPTEEISYQKSVQWLRNQPCIHSVTEQGSALLFVSDPPQKQLYVNLILSNNLPEILFIFIPLFRTYNNPTSVKP